MSKMIQIRNVPDDLHRTLKVRAARSGVSLSAYLLRQVEALARLPVTEDWLADVASDGVADLGEEATAAVRAEREAR